MIDIDVKLGDEITVSGKVTLLYNDYFIIIQGNSGEEYFINKKDIKTIRPNDKP